jgi:hypothetical protein
MDCINRLTEKLDIYEGIHWRNLYESLGTRNATEEVHANLWNDLANLRNLKPEQKANVMRDWKYKSDFEETELRHLDGKKEFLCSLEESFAKYMVIVTRLSRSR